MKRVQFTRHKPPFMPLDIASFLPGRADELIAEGCAIDPEAPVVVSTPVEESDSQAQGETDPAASDPGPPAPPAGSGSAAPPASGTAKLKKAVSGGE